MFKLKKLFNFNLFIVLLSGFLLIFLVSCSSNETVTVNSNDKRKEIKELEELIKVKPDDYKAYYNLGLLYSKQNEFDKSLENFNKAIQLKPEFEKGYTNIGCILYAQKNYPEAIENFNKVLTLEPENGRAYYNIGLAYYKNGEFDRALAALKKAKYYDGKLIGPANKVIEMIPAR